MRKNCALCNRAAAAAYCESDQASLCWACDSDVHRANFLVAKHPRVLLCRLCQAPTPFSASGVQLDPSPRACPACTTDDDDDDDDGGGGGATCTDDDYDDDESDGHRDDDVGIDDNDDEDDDQVVPSPTCIRRPTLFNKS